MKKIMVWLGVILGIGMILGAEKGFSTTVNNPMTENLDAGGYDIFNAGNVKSDNIITKKSPLVDVRAFGAIGNGFVDDTAAIQSAINSIPTGGMLQPAGGTIYIPRGNYYISATLNITDKMSLTLKGDGSMATTLLWYGAAGNPVVKIKNSRNITIKEMGIWGNPNPLNLPSAIIESQIDTTQPIVVPSVSENNFENLYLGGAAIDNATKGIVYTAAGTDTNNDCGMFKRVEVNNVIEAAFSLEHSQSKAHMFIDCGVVGGKRVVATSLGPGLQGGSFRWYGGSMSGSTIANFDMGNANDVVLISGANIENSARLLQTQGPAGTSWPIIIEGVRWDTTSLNPDGYVIKYTFLGPLTVTGSMFNSFSDLSPKIYLFTYTEGFANIIGNLFGTSSSTIEDPIVRDGSGTYKVMRIGNTYFSYGMGSAISKRDDNFVNGAYYGLYGISATGTPSNNLRGSLTISGTSTSGTVTFSTPESDANYYVVATATGSTGTPASGSRRTYITNKALTGFTVRLEVAPGTGDSVTVDWILIR